MAAASHRVFLLRPSKAARNDAAAAVFLSCGRCAVTVKRIFIAPYVIDRSPEPALCELSGNRRNNAMSGWRRFVSALLPWGGDDSVKRSPARQGASDRDASASRPLRRPQPRSYRLLNQRMHSVGDAAEIAGSGATEQTAVEYLMLEAIPPAQLRAGDFLLVEAGEWILADGLVVEGEALIDASGVTGESAAVVRSADGVREVMRDTQVIAGRIFLEITPRLGHPLDWQTV